VTLHATDLGLILLVVAAGCAVGYALLLRNLRHVLTKSNLEVADQMSVLDEAIRALEMQLAEHALAVSGTEPAQVVDVSASKAEERPVAGESEYVAPEIQAVIAAAATVALGQNAAVRSVRSVPAPWSQQGRVLVQGSHNLRVRQ
jgi:hypothetical protein